MKNMDNAFMGKYKIIIVCCCNTINYKNKPKKRDFKKQKG